MLDNQGYYFLMQMDIWVWVIQIFKETKSNAGEGGSLYGTMLVQNPKLYQGRRSIKAFSF